MLYSVKKEVFIMEKSKISAKNIAKCGMCTALIAVCAWIQIPMTVPFTLQTFGVFVAIGLLGGKLGTMSVLAYVLLGACGVPVFAGFSGGLGVIAGTTGGHIVGFIASALIMWLFERLLGKSYPVMISSMIAGLLVCYILGTVWFMLVYSKNNGNVGLMQTLSWCVIPFVIPDAVKIFFASIIVKAVRKYVNA